MKALISETDGLMKDREPLILFGAGTMGELFLKRLRAHTNIPVLFCDNNRSKQGTTVHGVAVIGFQQLKELYRNHYIVITSLDYYDQILKQLVDEGMHKNLLAEDQLLFSNDYRNYFDAVKNNIELFSNTYNVLADDFSKEIFYDRINYCITFDMNYLVPRKSKKSQYFESDIIKLSEDEIFIDGGAYVGDTVDEFIRQTGGAFKKIYSFEPETTKCREFREKYLDIGNIQLMPYGLWSKKTILKFNAEDSGSSQISEGGNIEIPVTSIDEVLGGEPVTFIKMDIEGAELEALRGAERSIRKYKPKLAICIYHKPLDMVEIPLYLKELVPEYKIYFRHYSNSMYETVCYAVAEEVM